MQGNILEPTKPASVEDEKDKLIRKLKEQLAEKDKVIESLRKGKRK